MTKSKIKVLGNHQNEKPQELHKEYSKTCQVSGSAYVQKW